MMKLSLILFCLLFSFQFNAQGKYKSLSWKIYGNELKDTSFLYGTMHTKDERAFNFKEEVLVAFDKASIYAMELNIDSINQTELINELIMDSTSSLKSLLSNKNYRLAENYFKDSIGISLFFFDKIAPIYTTQLVTANDLGAQKEEAMDLYFHEKAKDQKKKIVGLETAAEQINAFNSIPYNIQAKELIKAVKAAYKGENELDNIIAIYIEEDLDELLQLSTTNSSNKKYSTIINDIFIDKRNKKMAKRAEALILENCVFIAIGAAHLPGENGVIELLRKKGYLVEPF